MSACLLLITWSAAIAAAEPDHIALAAEHLAQGDSSQAIVHLSTHVHENPDAAMTRFHLAELLYRNRRLEEAASHFEVFINLAAPNAGKLQPSVIHGHTRLMAIATSQGDDGREHFHRGLGLLRLVQSWQADATRRDAAQSETTLVEALHELQAAAKCRPNDARVQLGLAEVSQCLGLPIQAYLRKARTATPGTLTGIDRERLATFAH